jgi:hypothetical protein
MSRIRRWIDSKRRVVWSEPKLPPYVKINPEADPDPVITQQPGDLSMRAVAEEFLEQEEEETLLGGIRPGRVSARRACRYESGGAGYPVLAGASSGCSTSSPSIEIWISSLTTNLPSSTMLKLRPNSFRLIWVVAP